MGIGSADAQRVDPRPQHVALPVSQPVVDAERAVVEVDGGVRRLIPQRGRQLPVVQRQRHLDQARDPGGGICVPDIGLDRTDPAGAHGIGRLAERLRQCGNLDRVAQIGAGAVALDITDGIRRDACHGLRLGNRAGLPFDRRRKIPRLRGPIVVDRRPLDHRPDVISFTCRIPCATQHHAARARTKDRPLSPMIEGVAMTIRRQNLAFGEQIAARVGQLDRHPARQRHVALAVQQGLRGVVNRDKAGRTRGLHVDRRALQVEDVTDPRGQKVLVVAGMAQQEHAGLIDQIAVRTQVEVEVTPHPATGINAYGTFEIFGRVAGILQRLPRHLHELAVLRVEDRGLLRREAEEVGVEVGETVQRRGGGHIVGAAHPGGVFARSQQLGLGQHTDRLDPRREVGPIGSNVGRAGQMGSHANDGNIGLAEGVLVVTACHVDCFSLANRRLRPKPAPRDTPTQFNSFRERGIPQLGCRSHHAPLGDNAAGMPHFRPIARPIKAKPSFHPSARDRTRGPLSTTGQQSEAPDSVRGTRVRSPSCPSVARASAVRSSPVSPRAAPTAASVHDPSLPQPSTR